MATGLFTTGFTVQEVVEIQAKAKAAVLQGLTVMSYSDSGTSVTKEWALSPREVLDECAYALSVLDPVTYPRAGLNRVRRHNYGNTVSI